MVARERVCAVGSLLPWRRSSLVTTHPLWACSGCRRLPNSAPSEQRSRCTRNTKQRRVMVQNQDEPAREPVLNYIIHRMNEKAPLHEVISEDYVRRNCSRDKIHELVNDPEFVHACREHLWQTFRSGELDPGRRKSQASTYENPADAKDAGGHAWPGA